MTAIIAYRSSLASEARLLGGAAAAMAQPVAGAMKDAAGAAAMMQGQGQGGGQ